MSPARILPRRRHDCVAVALLYVSVRMIACGTVVAQATNNSGVGTSATASGVTSGAADSITGQVINASTGLPVARALVRFNERSVLTDHDGNFQFAQNTEASGNVMIVKPGFYPTADPSDSANLYLQAGQLQTPLRLLLYPEALLTGTVTAPDGTPLPQIPVRALRSVFDEGGHRMTVMAQMPTDSHGRFRLTVPAGDYRVETIYVPHSQVLGLAVLPKSSADESSSKTFNIHGGEEQRFDLRPTLGQTHTITTAIDYSDHDFGFMRLTVRSGSGGSFQISPASSGSGESKLQLPQGTYTLVATKNSPEDPEQAETTVTVPDHDISGVVLRFSPYPSIPVEMILDSSSTSDNSQPVLQQLNLTLQGDQADVEDGGATIRATTTPNHSVAFVAPPGRYRLQAQGSSEWFVKSASYGSSDLLQQDFVVAPGSAGAPIRVMVSNQSGALQGTVKLDGNPAACWIYLIPTGPSAESVIVLRSNAEGAYSSAHLPPGGYQAVAFEHRFSANYRDQTALARFVTHVQSVTISTGDKPTVDLDAVSSAELVP